MAILDRFDRATLGANWESPAFPASESDQPLAMISGLDGVEMTPAAVNDDYCSGIYIGQEFDFNRQFSEVEIIEEIGFVTYTSWQDNYAMAACLLCVPLASSGRASGADFRLIPQLSWPSYGPMWFTLHIQDNTGSVINYTYAYCLAEDFFIADRVPVGTKLRLERIGDVFHGYLWSPDSELWYEVLTLEDSSLVDGYPGCQVYATDNAFDSRVTNFRAGTTGDKFLDLSAKVPGQLDAPGRRNKRYSRFDPGQNDVAYRLGENNDPEEETRDNKDRSRFS